MRVASVGRAKARLGESVRMRFRSLSRITQILFVVLIAAGVIGCEPPAPPAPDPPTAHDSVASLDDVEVMVLAVSVSEPEFVDTSGQSVVLATGAERMMGVTLQFTNTGEAEARYTPQHNASTETTPQLFLMPGDGADKLPVARIVTAANVHVVGQVIKDTAIAPGGALSDTYLFKLPPKDAEELLLVVPATLIGGDVATAVRFALPKEFSKTLSSALAKVGETITKGDIKVTVKGLSDVYVEAKKLSSKPGEKQLKYPYAYTVEPVLRIDFEIVNSGSQPTIYDPSHRADAPGVSLSMIGTKTISVKRFKLADANATANGQLRGPMQLEPGKVYKDFFLFQRPPAPKAKLMLDISAHIFGGLGIIQYEFSYNRKEPSPPDLEPFKKAAAAVPASPK